MLQWRTATFENICVADCTSKLEKCLPDVDYIYNNDPARKGFQCFKIVKISDDGDAAFLDIIRLDSVFTETIEILKRELLQKDRDGTEKRVVANCDPFLRGERCVVRIGTAQGSPTNMVGRRKLYKKGHRIPIGIGRLYKFHLPLACKQLLRNVLAIISRL